MKKIILNPMAIAALASMSLFSCASSDKMNDTSAMDDSTTMSETQTMAGDTEVETEMDTDANMDMDSNMDMDADMDYDAMFEDISNTAQYNIVALAQTNPQLSTFVSLVQAAGLADVLQGEGPYTVFAPTNAAFSKLPQEKLDMLMKPENRAELVKVLQLHVLPSKVSSMQFQDNQRIETADNNYINVNVDNMRGVTVGGAKIVKPNVEASNGLLHVVDGVIQTSTDNGQ
ncbi:fasciclin domain-containing protein [Pontibacter sp. MBLB2868]|uniref:fasciclin domain-containing protein n=1 Tax=Pontibacter sp. MBLB2868 TaxID=3451555 RepID=UPI003F752B88